MDSQGNGVEVDNEKDPDEEDTKSFLKMKRTKEPAGLKDTKDIVSEDATVKIEPYSDRPWRKLF